MNGKTGEPTEELLREYLAATDEAEAERRLAGILEDVAKPLVQRIVRSAVRMEDAEDVVADTILDLLRRLRDLRGPGSHPIQDFRRYIVTCAYNRCHERLRERYPARNRLRNQLRYLCNHDRNLALWRNADDALVCGFREWAGRDAVDGEPLADARVSVRSDPTVENRAQVAALVTVLLRHAGAPILLDPLASEIARLLGVEQQRTEVLLSELQPSRDVRADDALVHRTSLQQLWDDVRRLALKQRIALLLNLRDTHGRECLTLLPLTRTATIPEIAAAVGMESEAFAALWNRLPLSDVEIAEILGVTPRQVIKLRRLARERLRRMAKSRGDRNLRLDLDSSSNGATILTRR
jgi:RNA polymerase sigma factor (sigma-70 family)